MPAVVDLAAMRDAMAKLGGDAKKINPLVPVDLVIDHSVIVDNFGNAERLQAPTSTLEYERNLERYQFLRWGQMAFDNFRVVPPGTGICHQVNLEYLAQVVWTSRRTARRRSLYPDTLVGTDSHTTMVNGLAVLGWGVGGIEAEAAMLGQPHADGDSRRRRLQADRQAARKAPPRPTWCSPSRRCCARRAWSTSSSSSTARASTSCRSPTAPPSPTWRRNTARPAASSRSTRSRWATSRPPTAAQAAKLVEAYAKKQGLWRSKKSPEPVFTDTLSLDLGDVEPSLAGPKRPQDRVPLAQAAPAVRRQHGEGVRPQGRRQAHQVRGHRLRPRPRRRRDRRHHLLHQHVEPLRHAGRRPDRAQRGQARPQGQAVGEDLAGAGLAGRDRVSRGLGPAEGPRTRSATTWSATAAPRCIGNSGPLPDPVTKAIGDGDLVVCSVLSGNRNFEGRVNPLTRANYLASPMLVVVYALAGSMKIDITKDPIGIGKDGKPVYLKDIWPSNMEVAEDGRQVRHRQGLQEALRRRLQGRQVLARRSRPSRRLTYAWDDKSTYVRNPPYFDGMGKTPGALSNITGARPLGQFGNSITTDHISPAGSIKKDSPAGAYLLRARRRGQGLQPVRHAARQSRGDDARHLRQHPPQERDGAGHRGRLHPRLPLRPARCRSTTWRCATRRSTRRRS